MWKLPLKQELTALTFINILLGIALAVSPLLFAADVGSSASWSAYVAGLLIVLAGVVELVDYRPWQSWVTVALGLGAAVSPWVVGFAELPWPTWTHVAIGLLAIVVAAVELWLAHEQEPLSKSTT